MGDVHLPRPGTDLILLGEAVAPDGQPVESVDVSVAAAGQSKVVRVFGDRRWVTGPMGIRVGPPLPFLHMPLLYERAFGGLLDGEEEGTKYEQRNPVGVGYRSSANASAAVGHPVPNLEEPRQLLQAPGDRPPPAAFGYIAPSWFPRIGFAGIYDGAWRRERAPLLPLDFDVRFFCAAPPELHYAEPLVGGEPVQIVGATAGAPLSFRLPVCRLVATVAYGQEYLRPTFSLERVQFEPDQARMCLLWRAALPCAEGALRVKVVQVSISELSFP